MTEQLKWVRTTKEAYQSIRSSLHGKLSEFYREPSSNNDNGEEPSLVCELGFLGAAFPLIKYSPAAIGEPRYYLAFIEKIEPDQLLEDLKTEMEKAIKALTDENLELKKANDFLRAEQPNDDALRDLEDCPLSDPEASEDEENPDVG